MVSGIFDKAAYLHMQHIMKKRPLDINVETVTMCPVKCAFCCNRLFKRDFVVMDHWLFEDIVRQYCDIGGGTIGIGSMQSDFLSDPMLMERVKTIYNYKKQLWVHSTTTLISCARYDDKELLQILKCFDYLVVSVPGYDQKSYLDMAGIDGFITFKEQLKRIKKLIVKNNLEVQVDIAFRTNNKHLLTKSEFYQEVKELFPIGDIKDSFFSWFGSVKKEDLPKGAKLIYRNNQKMQENCVVPNATLAIQANGKAVGCGCIDWLEKYVIGDTNKNTLKEIWTSPKAIKFRNAFQTRGGGKRLPTICQECGLYISVRECLEKKELLGYKSKDGLYYCVKKKI